MGVFSREVLSRSSLTGGRSNANTTDTVLRPALDHVQLNDVLSEFAFALSNEMEILLKGVGL